jgi:hypothetical protein
LADKQDFSIEIVKFGFFYAKIFLTKNGLPKLLAAILNLPKITWVQNRLAIFGHK